LRRERWHDKLLETLRRQPSEWHEQTLATLRDAAARQDIVIYSDPKTAQPVRIQLIPLLLTLAQCQYLRFLGIRFRRVLNQLLRAYGEDHALQAVLPLSDDERAWLSQLAPKGFPEPLSVFERLDTNLLDEDPQWLEHFRFLEFNSVGVGCIHFMPVANQLIAEQVLPIFQETLTSTTCQLTADPRVLLRQLLEVHAKAIGRQTCVIAFVERRETSEGGADEMLRVSQWFQDQGLHTVLADPRDLDVRNDEVVYKDTIIDLVYRDFSLSEIVSIEKHGGQVTAMKHAFQHNQVVSALPGEFDHKSLFELFSSAEFDRYFTPSQRRAFRTFVPWTRLMRERKTTDANEREIDLVDYARRQREALVLKPNRAYGGQDVVIGLDATQAAWEEAMARALVQPDTWVVQAFAPLPQVDFLHLRDPSKPTKEFVTTGFIATAGGVAFVGRSSPEHIVNISRGGSLVPVFLVS